MYKKILIPLDNSSTDVVILDHIRKLVKLTSSHIVLVHVADGFAARLQGQLNLADSNEITEDQRYLNEQTQILLKEGITAKAFLLQGKEPADAILSLAESEKIASAGSFPCNKKALAVIPSLSKICVCSFK